MDNSKYVEILQKLANSMLERNGEYYKYSDDALIDMTVIFNEVFLSKMFDFNKDKLSDEDMFAIATEAGSDFRKLIVKYTGVDLHEAVKLSANSNTNEDNKRKKSKDGRVKKTTTKR